MAEHQTIEQQLFDWEDWDGDRDCMILYNCTLKKQIGSHAPRSEIAMIEMDYSRSRIHLHVHQSNDPEASKTYELILTVGNQIVKAKPGED